MSTRPLDAAIAEVARALVAQVAPQELPLFRTLSKAYFAHPDKPIPFDGGRDNPLGFGQGGRVSVATPAILAASSAVVSYVAGANGANTGPPQVLFAKVNPLEAQQATANVLAAAETDRVRLRDLLDTLFSLDDIRALCFNLGIDFDNLPGDTKVMRAQNLILYCEQRGRTDDLIRCARTVNPNMPWPAPNTDADKPNRLSTAQLAYVFQVALKTLAKSLPDVQAQQIAAAFVGSLAAGPAGIAGAPD